MSTPKYRLTGLMIARWAQDFNLAGDVAERMVVEGTPEFRMIVYTHFRTQMWQDATDRYFEDPDLMAIEDLTDELNQARAARPAAVGNVPGPKPASPFSPEVLERCKRAAENARRTQEQVVRKMR